MPRMPNPVVFVSRRWCSFSIHHLMRMLSVSMTPDAAGPSFRTRANKLKYLEKLTKCSPKSSQKLDANNTFCLNIYKKSGWI